MRHQLAYMMAATAISCASIEGGDTPPELNNVQTPLQKLVIEHLPLADKNEYYDSANSLLIRSPGATQAVWREVSFVHDQGNAIGSNHVQGLLNNYNALFESTKQLAEECTKAPRNEEAIARVKAEIATLRQKINGIQAEPGLAYYVIRKEGSIEFDAAISRLQLSASSNFDLGRIVLIHGIRIKRLVAPENVDPKPGTPLLEVEILHSRIADSSALNNSLRVRLASVVDGAARASAFAEITLAYGSLTASGLNSGTPGDNSVCKWIGLDNNNPRWRWR